MKEKLKSFDLKQLNFKKIGLALLFFAFMFFAGMGIGQLANGSSAKENPKKDSTEKDNSKKDSRIEDSSKKNSTLKSDAKDSASSEDASIVEKINSEGASMIEENETNDASILDETNYKDAISIKKTESTDVVAINEQAGNWGLGFGAEGSKPTGNASCDELKKYNAYFMGSSDDKVIYLTFDCGYENGNTEKILDALKKHNAHATFFVVGHFLESAPDLAKRMVEDGNTVGNHTYHHYDMSCISSKEKFQKEMTDVADLFKSITGQEMSMYYRPPQGKYSTENLTMAKELGYQTFFWSLAYVDWNKDKQPSHEEAFSKLTKRIHPGAVVLLHNTSQTNGEIIDELLTKWEGMGYTFKTLEDLIAAEK